MPYTLLADLLVAFHFGYVSFVVVGQLAIWIGLAAGWRWVRNPWFRLSHLLAIVIVAVEAIFGTLCPLTQWEADLRRLAGQTAAEGSFVARLIHSVIFVDVPASLIQATHICFALLVVATFLLAPPRWQRMSGPSSALASSNSD